MLCNRAKIVSISAGQCDLLTDGFYYGSLISSQDLCLYLISRISISNNKSAFGGIVRKVKGYTRTSTKALNKQQKVTKQENIIER